MYLSEFAFLQAKILHWTDLPTFFWMTADFFSEIVIVSQSFNLLTYFMQIWKENSSFRNLLVPSKFLFCILQVFHEFQKKLLNKARKITFKVFHGKQNIQLSGACLL